MKRKIGGIAEVKFAVVPGGSPPIKHKKLGCNAGWDLALRAVVFRGFEKKRGFEYVRETKTMLYDDPNSPKVFLEVGEMRAFGLGVCVEIPEGFAGYVEPRSSTIYCPWRNCRLEIANSAVPIDPNFRAELIAEIINHGPSRLCVEPGLRPVQLVIKQIFTGKLVRVPFEELSKSPGWNHCNGSTGL